MLSWTIGYLFITSKIRHLVELRDSDPEPTAVDTMKSTTTQNALVIGAGGGLGGALVKTLLAHQFDRVIAVSRGAGVIQDQRIDWQRSDYSERSISQICAALQDMGGPITRVCICNGTLHGDAYLPEKRLESVDPDAMMQVFRVNAAIPLMWVKALLPVLSGEQACVLSVFSARVGSIGDNRLGGWYSYRASKAALNMLLKTASIEYARRASNVKLISFHPGTTDTPLSKPFQGSVPDGKLFSPDFVAKQLLKIMRQVDPSSGLEYLDWQGQTIQW